MTPVGRREQIQAMLDSRTTAVLGADINRLLRQLQKAKENVGGSTQAMKHKNDARSLVMMSYDKIEPMIWERF